MTKYYYIKVTFDPDNYGVGYDDVGGCISIYDLMDMTPEELLDLKEQQ